jgi:serine/threonine protein kinase, bacterial
MPLSEGANFAGYTVVRLLGSGGMGEVYLFQTTDLMFRSWVLMDEELPNNKQQQEIGG